MHNARYFRYIVSNFRANWPPQFGDLVSYLGEFLLFFDYRNLKLYNFYTVQDRGIQSAYEMLCMKRAF